MKTLLSSLISAAGLEPVELDINKTVTEPNPADINSPVGGDHAFFTYFVPGAIFQAKDGSTWQVEAIPAESSGMCRIRNVWYPREEATIPQTRVRETIDMWVYPVTQVVPTLSKEN